jgi:hypothetical protein
MKEQQHNGHNVSEIAVNAMAVVLRKQPLMSHQPERPVRVVCCHSRNTLADCTPIDNDHETSFAYFIAWANGDSASTSGRSAYDCERFKIGHVGSSRDRMANRCGVEDKATKMRVTAHV